MGAKIPTHCAEHRELEMIDLKHRRCMVKNCSIYASYGLSGHQPLRCTTHKVTGDIHNPTKRCQEDDCRELAIFGYTTPNHCEQHKSDEEVDLVQRNCVKCGLPDMLDEKGHCPTCDPTLQLRVRLAKQKKVREFFDYNQIKYISYDQIIERGVCGYERPDFLLDCDKHMIVVEVDEHQHGGYPCSCEQMRMVNIGQSLGIQVLFIRYNPDKYKPATGRAINKESHRLETLKQQIEYWTHKSLPSDGCCFVTYLYYDGDDPSSRKSINKLL
jgi:hypothetical protein